MVSLLLQLTPLALGVAASPLPVVAVLIILLTRRARVGAVVMAASWVAGNALMITITMVFAGAIPSPKQGTDLTAEGVFTLLLGVGLIVMGALARRGRRNAGPESNPPAWVRSVDDLSPLGAGLVAFSNATTSPKNLALAVTAGRMIARSGLPVAEMVVPMVWYVGIASLTIVIPVIVYFVGGDRAAATLMRWRERVTANAAAVMEITLLVLGIGLSAKGIWNLLT